MWHLDQKIVLTLFVNFYRAKIGAQFDTDITSVFNVTHECIQLVKSATVYFTSNFAGIFIFMLFSPMNNLGKNFMMSSPRVFFTILEVLRLTKQLVNADRFRK